MQQTETFVVFTDAMESAVIVDSRPAAVRELELTMGIGDAWREGVVIFLEGRSPRLLVLSGDFAKMGRVLPAKAGQRR